MKEYIYEIDPKTMDYLQMLSYEFHSYKSLLTDILLEKRKYKHNIETYEYFMEEYKNTFIKFETLKEEIINIYIGEIQSIDSYDYIFDFNERTLTIKFL